MEASLIECPNCKLQFVPTLNQDENLKCPSCGTSIKLDTEKTKKKGTPWYVLFLVSLTSIFIYENYIKDTAKDNPKVDVENKVAIKNSNELDNKLSLLVNAIDVENPISVDYASQLASRFQGNYNIGQVCNIYDYIVNNWKYVNDPRRADDFRSASRTIKNNLTGDCDDFAILMATMIESIGGKTRISFAYNNNEGHAFAEVYVGDNMEDFQLIVNDINALYHTDQFEINYNTDEKGAIWMNLDWFGQPQHPGGKYFEWNKRIVFYPTENKPTYQIYEQ